MTTAGPRTLFATADRDAGMDLTPEQEAVRETVRQFALEEIRPLAREADRNEEFLDVELVED